MWEKQIRNISKQSIVILDLKFKQYNNGFANIFNDSIVLFLPVCEKLLQDKMCIGKGVVVKPVLSKEFTKRGHGWTYPIFYYGVSIILLEKRCFKDGFWFGFVFKICDVPHLQ